MSKEERQVQAANTKVAKALKRVYSLSQALLRAQVLLDALINEEEDFRAAAPSDDRALKLFLEDTRRLQVSPVSRVLSFSPLFLATLYAVAEKWQEWDG